MPPTLGNGKICYLEIPAIDIALSADFYKRVFGWKGIAPRIKAPRGRLKPDSFDRAERCGWKLRRFKAGMSRGFCRSL